MSPVAGPLAMAILPVTAAVDRGAVSTPATGLTAAAPSETVVDRGADAGESTPYPTDAALGVAAAAADAEAAVAIATAVVDAELPPAPL